MNIILQNQAIPYNNGAYCTAWEYAHGNKDINLAVIDLTGCYPEKGFAINTKVSELVFVVEGQITLETVKGKTQLTEGDSIILDPNEKFRWSGSGKMAISCTPAWSPQQYKYVD